MTPSRMIASVLLAASCTTIGLAQDDAAPAIQPEARAVMKRMFDFYKTMKGATFTSTLSMTGAGLPMELEQTSMVKIARPNLFQAKTKEDPMMGGGIDCVGNGKNIMISMAMFDLYSEIASPADFTKLRDEINDSQTNGMDAMDMMASPPSIAMINQDPGLAFGILLFSDDPMTAMLEEISGMTLVGTEEYNGVEAQLIKFAGEDAAGSNLANIEMWIATGEKPWVLGMQPDMDAMEGDPMMADMEVKISFKDWKSPELTASDFDSTPEENWTRVDNLMDAVMAKANEMQGGMGMPEDMDFPDGDFEFEEPEHPTLGTAAPDFTLKTLRDGKDVTLSDLRGKVVVLDFWATWCGPCVAGLPTVDKVTSSFKDKGVVFYAVDLREPANRVQSFVDKKKWTFPVLMDEKGSVASSYGVSGIPHSIVIGKDGTILNVHIGFGGAEAMEKQLTEELEAALGQPDPAS